MLALGCFINGRHRPSKFNNAGKNVNPAIMHVAIPVAIRQPNVYKP
jgi:hypothetical protein